MSDNVIVVGGGIFGCMAARALERQGRNVTVIDAKLYYSGSSAAGCIIRPSWIESLGNEITDPAFSFLYREFRPVTTQFKQDCLVEGKEPKEVPAFVIPPTRIMDREILAGHVTRVGDGWLDYRPIPSSKAPPYNTERLEGIIVIAAGVWCNELVKMPEVHAMCGSSFVFKGSFGPRIKQYAPYKQIVYFPRPETDQTWFGDGTAILRRNYHAGHDEQSMERAEECGLPLTPLKHHFGMRPYIDIPGQPGCLLKITDKLFVTTGGAKNGCLLGAYQAVKLAEMIGG